MKLWIGVLLLVAAFAANGDDDYQVRSEGALACGATEYFPIQKIDHVPDGCRTIPRGQTLKWQASLKDYVSGWVGHDTYWFRKADVEPIDPRHDPATAAQCKDGQEGGGGEVDRLEEDAQGRLYHKRYLVTTKCVKGRWREYSKKLN